MPHFLSPHSLCRFMRDVALASLCWVSMPGWANDPQPIYRCGNAYTNQPNATQNCKLVSNTAQRVIVIEGTRVQGSQVTSASAKVDSVDQRQRDVQAQAVLQAELQRAQRRQADLQIEWRNGEPERRADEFRQPQKYQDRMVQLRDALQRVEADVAGLQRELSRLPVIASTGVKP